MAVAPWIVSDELWRLVGPLLPSPDSSSGRRPSCVRSRDLTLRLLRRRLSDVVVRTLLADEAGLALT